MPEVYGRQVAFYRNVASQARAQLVGIATGLLADGVLTDGEIRFLDDWIAAHDEIAYERPGNLICPRVKAVLADGVITEEERDYPVATLRQLVGASPEGLTHVAGVTELAFDDAPAITSQGATFCLTGDFTYAPRPVCDNAIRQRGGVIGDGVSKRLQYLAVSSLGSPEWKHGSSGTKIEQAMQLKGGGAAIPIIKEEHWASAL